MPKWNWRAISPRSSGPGRCTAMATPKGRRLLPLAYASRRPVSTPSPPGRWRSGALTFVPLPGQLFHRAGEGRLEVDQLRPRRHDDDPDHAVVDRPHLGLPRDPLLGRHLIGAVHLQVLVRDALDDVQLGPTADEQDLWRVHLGVDRQGDRRVVAQRRDLRGVLGGAHDDRRAVPDEPDRDGPRRAVLGDVGQAGQVAGQELLADRTVQDLGDLARLHGQPPLPTVVPGPHWATPYPNPTDNTG